MECFRKNIYSLNLVNIEDYFNIFSDSKILSEGLCDFLLYNIFRLYHRLFQEYNGIHYSKGFREVNNNEFHKKYIYNQNFFIVFNNSSYILLEY